MKKLLLLFTFAVCITLALPMHAQRYLTEVFTSAQRTEIYNIQFAINTSILTGGPAPDTLNYDVYRPMGDTLAQRPVILLAHTGSLLPPPFNGQATGSIKDSALVEMARKLCNRGFVVINFEYRLGWNPTSTNQETRTATLIQAAYRGIQDVRTLARYLRDDVANGGNQHGINPNRIIVGGMGTGGYISYGAAFLDSYDEINLAKFLDGNGASYVDTSLMGDLEGKWTRALSVGNFPNENSDIAFAFSMGGAVGDSTWIEAGETPTASVHVPSDPFAPYTFGPVIVPTTGDFVVDVSGSYGVQHRTGRLGNNNPWINNTYIDPTSMQAATVNEGINSLMPFYRPGVESAPWEYWDSTYWKNVPHPLGGNFHTQGLATNPDMSHAKSSAYIDSTLNFVVPRIVCALGLPGCIQATVSNDAVNEAVLVKVYPNPSASFVNIASEAGNLLQSVTVTDLSGRQVKVANGLKATDYRLEHGDLSPGMYFLSIQTKKGVVTQKVLFN